MTPHLHSTVVDGCYRCELGLDEQRAFIAERRGMVISVLSAYADHNEAAADAVLGMLNEEGYL